MGITPLPALRHEELEGFQMLLGLVLDQPLVQTGGLSSFPPRPSLLKSALIAVSVTNPVELSYEASAN
jgi:hypothetical protein